MKKGHFKGMTWEGSYRPDLFKRPDSGGSNITIDSVSVTKIDTVTERVEELEKTVKLLTNYIIELNKQLENEKVQKSTLGSGLNHGSASLFTS